MSEVDEKTKLKFEKVRGYIQAKEYGQALALLETIKHPTARQWEARVEAMKPPRYEVATQSRRGLRIAILLALIAVFIVIIVILRARTADMGPYIREQLEQRQFEVALTAQASNP